MTKKPDYDLSNPGGKPKTWMDQDGSDEGWLGDAGMVVKIVGAGLLLLGGAGFFLFKLLQYSGNL